MVDLKNKPEFLNHDDVYEKVLRFADEKLKKRLESYQEYAACDRLYNWAIQDMEAAVKAEDYRKVAKDFEILEDFKDSEKKCKCA